MVEHTWPSFDRSKSKINKEEAKKLFDSTVMPLEIKITELIQKNLHLFPYFISLNMVETFLIWKAPENRKEKMLIPGIRKCLN